MVDAYNRHHALIVRPDDVWLAILTQFNLFVNANAEDLRKQFVAHEEKKELEIKVNGSRYSVDYASIAQKFTELISENVVDPSLREWILPNFTTTTPNDTTVAAVVMMATLKAYFSYTMTFCCGIPCVTVEGEKEDWESILTRLEKLKEYGPETTAWYNMLVPVISRFVKGFDDPSGDENTDFWSRVANYEHEGSGSKYISGWITAFCVFDRQGKWVGPPLDLVRNFALC
jgi:hypothetical protein